METPINSSFIPADVRQPTPTRMSRRGSSADFFVLISIVLFVASLILGAAVFLYQGYLTTSNKGKLDSLERAKAAFEPALIDQLTRLDDRMTSGAKILDNHEAPSRVFDLLEQSTLTTVSFSSFDFDGTDRSKMTVKMQGVAKSVNSIALQADLLGKSGILTSPIFSDITQQGDGVHFNLSAVVNPHSIRYVQVEAAPAQQQKQPQTQTGAQSGSSDGTSAFTQ